MLGPEWEGSRFLRRCLITAALLIGCGSLCGVAMADLISGNAELDYSLVNSKSSGGGSSNPQTRTDSFTQRYNIGLTTNPYPNLRLAAGSFFELDRASSRMGSADTSSSVTTIYPFADLSLGTPLYNGAIGYSRKQDTLKGTGILKTTTIIEEYHANFGWKPEAFPATSLRLSRTNNFDADRLSINSTNDYASLGMRYAPAKGLDLRYQATYNDTVNHIADLESSGVTHNGVATYSGLFFNQRVTLYSSYNFTRQDSTTTAHGIGEVETQVFPFGGLSAFNNTPLSGASDQNPANGALIDAITNVGAGINIGVPPLGQDPSTRWSIGLDFGIGASTPVNSLVVFVDRQLPAAIANSFSWDVYIRNSDTQDWTIWRTGIIGQFSFFPAPQNSFGFRIPFDTVATRFIKVVVTPLSQAVAAQNPSFQNPGQILVTELQAFIARPVQDVQGHASSTSHVINVDVRTRILDQPSLYHSISLLASTAGTSDSNRYALSNSLNLSHQLSRIFAVGANVEMQNAKLAAGNNLAFVYNASLKATPLAGLTHTLLYSGRTESTGGTRTNTNSFFVYNSAQPYRGISFSLSGGVSESSNSGGGTTQSVQVITGTSVTPMKALTMNLNYSRSRTTISGGENPAGSSSSQTGSLSVSYRPFASLYLFVSFGMVGQENTKTEYTQNYGLNWSPFSEGDLQFNFVYNQSLSTRNSTKSTLLSPSISWRITSRTLLDISYPIITGETGSQTTETTVLSVILRTSF